MFTAIKAASTNNSTNATSIYLRVAFFHSTPVSYRRRKANWGCGGRSSRDSHKRYNNSRRFIYAHPDETLLHNIGDYAKYLFQSWRDDNDCSDPSSSKGPSSFKRQYWDNGAKRNSSQRHPQWETFRGSGKGGFHFVYNVEEDLDTIFQSAFVGERFSYQSFVNGDDRSQTGNSHRYSSNHKTSSNWRYRSEDDYRTYKDFSENSDPDLSSDRSILGLSTYGPLKLEDVKTAYRTCALKWHPDRHQGSTKGTAEEKFKCCSAAYQSLCENLE